MTLAGKDCTRPVASALVSQPSSPRFLALRSAVACAAAVAAVVAGCSDGNPQRDDLVSSLVKSGIAEPVAECTADAILETLDDEELAQVVARGPGGAPVNDPAVPGETADDLDVAMAPCVTMKQELDLATTTSVAPTVGGTSGASTTTLPLYTDDDAELNPASTTTP